MRANGNGIDINWIEKVDGWDEITIGKIRPNSNENCNTQAAIGAAGYLLLLMEQ